MPADAPALTREEVVTGYRLILGRPPESEEVILSHRAAHGSLEGFGEALRASEEYRRRQSVFPEMPPPLDAPPQPGEVTAEPATLAAILACTARYWSEVGAQAPHWSVLTENRFLPDQIEANRDAFFGSGAWDVQVLGAVLARMGRDFSEFQHGVDYGCGVGRITVHLAERLPRLTGVDISPPHLALAAAELQRRGLSHVGLAQARVERLMPVPACDLWYSRIVLQHNPPPVIMEILRQALAALRPGGVAVFQVPTYIAGYAFDVAGYLAGAPGAQMEMHAVPQRAVLDLAEGMGCVLRDIREDSALVGRPGEALSNTFGFEKRG